MVDIKPLNTIERRYDSEEGLAGFDKASVYFKHVIYSLAP